MKTFILIFALVLTYLSLPLAFSKIEEEGKGTQILTREGITYQCVKQGQIQYQTKKGSVLETQNYCYNVQGGYILSHDKCFFSACKSEQICTATLKKADVDSPYGSYEFKLCHACDGKGQIFEFFDFESHQYIKTARCLFRDGSFIDLGTLLRESKVTFE